MRNRIGKRLIAILMAIGILASAIGMQVFAADSIEPGKYDDPTREDVAHIIGLKLSADPDDSKNVWGYGITTGTGPFDADDERGNDSTNNNDRVRSYDSVTYNVEVVVQSNDLLASYPHGRVGYQFIIPNDKELELDLESMDWAEDAHTDIVGDEKIYTVYRDLPTTNGAAIPGGCTVPFVLKIGGKVEGDTLNPRVIAWAEGNDETMELNPATVKVTSIPKYNIQLIRYSGMGADHTYDFTGNAYNGDAGKVLGSSSSYGFVLQLRNENMDKGVRGLEVPTGPITFDIDMTALFKSNNVPEDVTDTFTPLLWSIKENGEANQILEMPMTKGDGDDSCVDSGVCTAVQNGSKLTFTVEDYVIDMNGFPRTSKSGQTHYYSADGKLHVGCFAAFKFSVIFPLEATNGDPLKPSYGAHDSIEIDLVDSNMQAVSATGTQVTDQTVTTDDTAANTRNLTIGGNRDHEIFYSNPDNRGEGLGGSTAATKLNGADLAPLGAEIAFTAVYNERNVASADTDNHTLAADQLIKFDDTAIEIDIDKLQKSGQSTAWNWKVKFAAKPNGLGWDHNDLTPEEAGYDTEMLNARQEDLVYYDTYEELKAANAVCVGLLYQLRGLHIGEGGLQYMHHIKAKIKPVAEVAKHVYALHISTNAWLVSDVYATAAASMNKSADEMTQYDYREYAKSYFDRDMAAAPMDHSVNIDKPNYVKAVYDNCIYQGGDTAGFSVGDSLYVIPYESIVSLTVAQKNGFDSKESYDMDAGQRYVDYVMVGGMKFNQAVNISTDMTTTVTMSCTLDKNLKYIPGTSFWGGEYEEKTPNPGLVANGINVEPVESVDKDGNPVLTWTLTDVPVASGYFEPIYFSCQIGDQVRPEEDVQNQQVLVSTSTIETTEDRRAKSVNNGNVATASVTVIKLASFNITKNGTHSLELKDTGSFELIVNNSSDTHKSNLYAIDTMPHNGINGTVMAETSKYAITSMKIDLDAIKDISDVTFYYTNDQAYLGKTTADVSMDDIKDNWTKATLSEDGTITGEGLIGSWPVAFAYADDKLNAKCTALITFEYTADATKGDKLYNTFSEQTLRKISEVVIYSRSISGKAWFDNDKDGIREETDKLLSGVTVNLLGKHGLVVATTVTDENGDYWFDGLPAGNYSIEFKDDAMVDWDVTKMSASGAEEGYCSKAEAIYGYINTNSNMTRILAEAYIYNVSLPSLVDMRANSITDYELLHQDAGFVTMERPTTTTESTTTTTESTTTTTESATTTTESTTTTTESTTITTESATTTESTTAATATETTTTVEETTTTIEAEEAIPETGDSSLATIFAMFATLSLAVLGGLKLARKKQ